MNLGKINKKIQKMDVMVFRRVLLYNLIMLIGVIAVILFLTFRFTITERGNARVELLRQISDSNASNRDSMMSVMNYAYEIISDALTVEMQGERELKMRGALSQTQQQIDAFGFEYKIDVVLNDKTSYSSYAQIETELKSMLQSYWYIKHFSGESDTSWSLRFQDAANVESYSLCYARTLYSSEGNVVGVVMLSSSSAALFRTYQRLLDTQSTIYILDENGIVISHSNSNMIGLWLYTIDSFFNKYREDSFVVTKKLNSEVMISNYRDPDSGWVFVEEQPIADFFYSYAKILFWILPIIVIVFLAMILQSYFSAKKITKPLMECAHHMDFIRDDNFALMPVQQQYKEIEVLSEGYNAMLLRIRTLIENIKEEEDQKRQIEFAFLQAQINPHFLRNTLLGIKSLIITEKKSRAAEMITAFTEMLNIPIKAELQGHSLRDEIEYVRHYITLMQCRYDRAFYYTERIEEELQELIIPPLILQPLIENAIFHGLATREEEEGTIVVTACRTGENILLIVEDNGEGMTEEERQNIWIEKEKSRNSINSVGLKNVLSRVKYVFGEESHIEVKSKLNQGTTVCIVIVPKEERDENFSG